MTQRTAFQPSLDERWCVVPDSRLSFRYWDGECVLFHGASGSTHRLPAVVGNLLQNLLPADTSIGELSERIDLHEDDVRFALQDLGRLGIVKPCA